MWDERYAVNEYVYGTVPNDFLKDNIARLKKGRVLSLGEGEGRNGVFLAQQGFAVSALDASEVGLKKARRLARGQGVKITTIHTDLGDYSFEPESWDTIISIFCHLPPELRRRVHQGAATGLKPGGTFLLEGYTPRQLQYKTGGPPTEELMLTLEMLKQEFSGLKILYGKELVRPVSEGKYHNGQAAVVQFIAQKVQGLSLTP